MPSLSKSKIIAHRQCQKRLWLEINKPEKGCFDDSQVTTDKLRKIHRVTKKTTSEVDPAARLKLGGTARPRYYIDFETINPAVPLWQGVRPFEPVPYQWSCHTEDRDGKLTHREYLAKGEADPRREFIETLLAVLCTRGSIFIYNIGAKGCVLKKLVERFPDLAPRINAVRERLVDLLPITREHYYHRDQLGSWTIKAVLPTIDPGLAYDTLEVANGGDAMAAYATILNPATSAREREALRKQLLEYCARDTEAMIALVKTFEEA